MKEKDVGVFVGVASMEYGTLLKEDAAVGYGATGQALSIAAARLSYTYDLRGPAMAVDTACSSSLVAADLALKAVRRGDGKDGALIGGVNLILG